MNDKFNAPDWTPLAEEYSDFRVFLREAWLVLGLPSPTPAQYRFAWFLQNSKNRRRGLRAFRGAGKSWISSVWVCYCLRHNPQYKFLIVSASKERADNFTTFTRQLIDQWPLLHCLIPTSDQRDSRISFDVRPATPDHAPSVKSVGVTGQLSGSRADEIIADDVEVSNNSETQGKRDKLLSRINEFESILKPNGYITFLGTPQTEDSVYTHLQEKGYTELIFPALYPDFLSVPIKYGSSLDSQLEDRLRRDPSLAGTPTDPDRFTLIDLQEREQSIGKSTFALQFMLDTSLSDKLKYPLKLSDLIVTDVDPDLAPERFIHSSSPAERWNDVQSVGLKGDYYYRPRDILGRPEAYQGSVMYIDPSGRGADETAYAVVKTLNSYLYVPPEGVGGFTGGYAPDTLEALAQIAKKHKVNTVIIESNFGDGMFKALISPFFTRIHPVHIEEDRANVQKEKRIIDTLEPVLNQHRLVIDKTLIEFDKQSTLAYSDDVRLSKQLFYQMSRITKDKGSLRHDDRLDCLAGAVNYWVQAMAQNLDAVTANNKTKYLDQQLRAIELGSECLTLSALGMDYNQVEKALRGHSSSQSSVMSGL